MVYHNVPLSKYYSNYELTPAIPINIYYRFPFFKQGKEFCPFYAPDVSDTNCRFCGLVAKDHRKYYSYQNYARIIQKNYFNYLFKKFLKINKENKAFTSTGQFYIQRIYRYKQQYWRKWDNISFQKFMNNL